MKKARKKSNFNEGETMMRLYEEIKAKEIRIVELTKSVRLLGRLADYAGKRLVDEAAENADPREMHRRIEERKFLIEKVKKLELKLEHDE